MPPERSEKPGHESLEGRLRRLPPPPVPADLEARLLAAIPARVTGASASGVASAPRVLPALTQPGSPSWQRWGWWICDVSALAAACLLIVLLWPKGNGQKPDQKDNGFAGNDLTNGLPSKPSHEVTPFSMQTRRASDEPKLPPFTWPVDETTHVTLSSSIPSDLLN